MTEAFYPFPLSWPAARPRTERPTYSPFKTTLDRARREVVDQIRLMNGTNTIISTNQKLRQDGFPYAGLREPDDKGVAVYFKFKGRPMVFACDRWNTIGDNLHAVAKTIEALRGIARWGSGDMMEQAFTGFTALPAGASEGEEKEWWQVLGFTYRPTSFSLVKQKRNELARMWHPDIGESPNEEMMISINAAYEKAQEEMC